MFGRERAQPAEHGEPSDVGDSPSGTAGEDDRERRRRQRVADREGAAAGPAERGTMIPARSGRSLIESFFMRIVATAGIVGIGVAIAAIMQSSGSRGWLIGLVVSIVAVILAAVLWSARRL